MRFAAFIFYLLATISWELYDSHIDISKLDLCIEYLLRQIPDGDKIFYF